MRAKCVGSRAVLVDSSPRYACGCDGECSYDVLSVVGGVHALRASTRARTSREPKRANSETKDDAEDARYCRGLGVSSAHYVLTMSSPASVNAKYVYIEGSHLVKLE